MGVISTIQASFSIVHEESNLGENVNEEMSREWDVENEKMAGFDDHPSPWVLCYTVYEVRVGAILGVGRKGEEQESRETLDRLG
ncbi:hypothetical protein KM043_005458 [Ampulex compressa]|nr:hypothetical protein KM043_005458 [Ampulex compressa]